MGGDRPSQTTHQTRSRMRIYSLRLEQRECKGGISRLTPPRLAPRLPSLPPILHMVPRCSMPGYSKGSRGLSVLPQEHGICTATPTSLSLQSRQWGIRYAIRAGRNLPDKEFRYLRTVIVTAAVYRGLSSKLLACAMTSPHDLPAPGRRQTLYFLKRVSRVLCFC